MEVNNSASTFSDHLPTSDLNVDENVPKLMKRWRTCRRDMEKPDQGIQLKPAFSFGDDYPFSVAIAFDITFCAQYGNSLGRAQDLRDTVVQENDWALPSRRQITQDYSSR